MTEPTNLLLVLELISLGSYFFAESISLVLWSLSPKIINHLHEVGS